ncbi:hypothetical protein CHUAL_013989 [Chamberlinius hualienensis]
MSKQMYCRLTSYPEPKLRQLSPPVVFFPVRCCFFFFFVFPLTLWEGNILATSTSSKYPYVYVYDIITTTPPPSFIVRNSPNANHLNCFYGFTRQAVKLGVTRFTAYCHSTQ